MAPLAAVAGFAPAPPAAAQGKVFTLQELHALRTSTDAQRRNRGEFERAAVRGVIKSAFERYRCGNTAPKPFEF